MQQIQSTLSSNNKMDASAQDYGSSSPEISNGDTTVLY